MRPPPPAPDEDSALVAQVRRILGDVPGESVRWSPLAAAWGPLPASLALLLAYGLIWMGVEAVSFWGGWHTQPKLVSLLVWGGWYFAAAHFFQQNAVPRLIETIERDIEPHAKPAYVERVTADLRRRYGPAVSLGLPAAIAAASMVAAVWAVDIDIEDGKMSRSLLASPEFLFFAVTYYIYFFTAAQAVVAARFYLSFASHLEEETDALYVLGAAESPLVIGLSRLSGQVLIFWLMLFLTIVSSMFLAGPWPDGYAFDPRSRFLLILVPVAGFFSLGFGSLVYLVSESKIRVILRRFTHAQLEPVRERSNALFATCATDLPKDRKALVDLADLHDRIVAGGRYGSRLGAALSLALPLALPIISIIKLVVDS